MSDTGKMALRKKKPNFFDFRIDLDSSDLDELFAPYDPLKYHPSDLNPLGSYGQPYDPIDHTYIRQLMNGALGDIVDHYFRARLINKERIPSDGPAILASNHSGNAFPHDGIVLNALLWRESIRKKEPRFIRSMYSPKLAKSWWMRAFTVDDFWRKCGAIDQTFVNYDHVLQNGRRLIYYPEGIPGIGKGFNRRYQLQHFYSSFVVLAARHNAPVIPVYTINGEWVNPANITYKWIDRIVDKLLGIPFLPLPNAIFALIFPFIFYLSFPCNLTYKFGKPINIREMLREVGCKDVVNPDRASVHRVAARVRKHMQPELDQAVDEYGRKPYHCSSLRKHFSQNKGKRWRLLPTGWPIAFLGSYRNRFRKKPRNRLHALLRDWDFIFFYLPLGWIGLSLCRRFRKPPYGYRGLSDRQRTLREGSYFWNLDDRPLPAKEKISLKESPQRQDTVDQK